MGKQRGCRLIHRSPHLTGITVAYCLPLILLMIDMAADCGENKNEKTYC